MQSLSSHPTRRTLATLRLLFAAAVTTLLLIISFSPGAQTVGTAAFVYPSELVKNGGCTPDGTHPRWKILVLIYDRTDALVTDTAGVQHHMVATMTPAEVERATLAATQFVETDIPALTSGNMIPELTIRYPAHALTQLDPFGQAWWPSPANTAPERDPAFDSVIVIWDPRVVDQYTGTHYWIGGGAGLTAPMNAGQTYATIIIEATGYGHRNVFKHEWGHSILFYFDAIGVAPKPTVTNHANINQYVHWPTGENYVWVDETDANPIPNSIYYNQSGFTHDYYSGTTATADQPTRRLGITPEAWMLGGPVTKPGVPCSGIPPVITCGGDIVVDNEPGNCAALVTLRPPAVFDPGESNLSPVATRSDGGHVDAPYSCGQTVVTWTVTNSANATSTCQQVVTVRDEESPVFLSSLPSLTVMTGPDATSCGAVVDDAALRGPGIGLNPVVLDPIGDVRPDPYPALQADITSVKSTFNMESLTFTVNFADRISAPSSSQSLGFYGFIDIDTDQNPATGIKSNANVFFTPPITLGVDFSIDVFSEWVHPGLVDVISRRESRLTVVGRVPITFAETSLSVTVPLTLLGGDNGSVNYAAYFGVVSTTTDRVPNDAVPLTSSPATEVVAFDNCSQLVFKRVGVPANSLFPVGETLITYTATDASGNTASATQTVTVIDNTPPVISRAAASPSTLWPPNHEMVDVTVNYETADNCDILETWLGVSSNEPAAGNSDWEIVDAHRVRLLAAKLARWEDRVYTITVTAKDIHGNLSSQNVIVRVPQNRGKGGVRASAVTGQRPSAAPLMRSHPTRFLAFAVQTRRFTKPDVEYELELPSPAWQVNSRIDVHDHLEFVNGNDVLNGYLRLRKITVAQPTTAAELFKHDEEWELRRLPGYVICSQCDGISFNGQLSGTAFSYEYVSGGRTMYGRIYYLQLDSRTFYSLRFTVARDKLNGIQEQMDFIARSFHLK